MGRHSRFRSNGWYKNTMSLNHSKIKQYCWPDRTENHNRLQTIKLTLHFVPFMIFQRCVLSSESVFLSSKSIMHACKLQKNPPDLSKPWHKSTWFEIMLQQYTIRKAYVTARNDAITHFFFKNYQERPTHSGARKLWLLEKQFVASAQP